MNQKEKKFYEKWWFWVIIAFVIVIIGTDSETTDSNVIQKKSNEEYSSNNNNDNTESDTEKKSTNKDYEENNELENLLNNMEGWDAYRSNVYVESSDNDVIVSYEVTGALTNEILLKVIFNDYYNYSKNIFNNYENINQITFNINGILVDNTTHDIKLSITKNKFNLIQVEEGKSIYDTLKENCDTFDINNINDIDKNNIYYVKEEV